MEIQPHQGVVIKPQLQLWAEELVALVRVAHRGLLAMAAATLALLQTLRQ